MKSTFSKKIGFIAALLFAVALSAFASEVYQLNFIAVASVATAGVLFMPQFSGVASMNNTNNISARDSFRKAKDLFIQAWSGKFGGDMKRTIDYVEGLKLSQSEIRLEVGLTTTTSTFTFGVTPNQASTSNTVFNTEQRLQLQDSLVVSEYGIFVAQPASATDTQFRLRTYGNTQDFGADATGIDTTFYNNGFFSVKCNNDVIIPYRGLFNHWYKPETQQTAALGAGSPGDQVRGAEDGMITQEPNVLLIGSKNYQPQIQLPAALASATANLRAVLIFRGVLAQNSTVVN